MINEEFRAIAGYEGVYEVSNAGIVRSLDRQVPYGRGATRLAFGCVLSPMKWEGGYQYVNLYSKHPGKMGAHFSVHRLVATAFIPKSHPDLEVNHLDGNKSNNCVGNLAWVTKGENVRHARDNGWAKDQHGEKNSCTKLTNLQAAEIKSKYAAGGYTHACLAKQYGVSPTTIWNIVNGRYWQKTLVALTDYQGDGK